DITCGEYVTARRGFSTKSSIPSPLPPPTSRYTINIRLSDIGSTESTPLMYKKKSVCLPCTTISVRQSRKHVDYGLLRFFCYMSDPNEAWWLIAAVVACEI